MLENVQTYINENILQSAVWDKATDVVRKKAINTANRSLMRLLPNIYPTVEAIPVEHTAEQAIWCLKIDDSFQRAELGATSMAVDGFSISIKERNRSIAPFIMEANNITPDAFTGGVTKRKVGNYTTSLVDAYHGIRTYPLGEAPFKRVKRY